MKDKRYSDHGGRRNMNGFPLEPVLGCEQVEGRAVG